MIYSIYVTLSSLFDKLSKICRTASKKVVLIIDEVDSASNNQVFVYFLAQLIFDHTSGYTFLVSRICKLIDETPLTWDEQEVEAAVKQVLNEQNTLFDDMIKKLNNYPEVSIMLRKTNLFPSLGKDMSCGLLCPPAEPLKLQAR